MEFETPSRRRLAEPFVPMINVVFLLLIFFLMTAEIAPPEPFDVSPPAASEGGEPEAETILHLSGITEFGFGDFRGDAAIEAALAAAEESGGLRLRVDAGAPASALASIAARISADGISRLEIVTTRR